MKTASIKIALTFAALLGSIATLPMTSAPADAAAKADEIATVMNGTTGTYDDLDRFKDSAGHPLQGWGYLYSGGGGV